MRTVLYIQSAAAGVLWVNGVFCGPMERGGQAFPAGRDAEVYIQFFPLAVGAACVTAALKLRDGRIETLAPKESAYALCWPDGIIQIELLAGDGRQASPPQEERAMGGVLLRYLTMRLLGDPQAQFLLMRPQDAPDLSAYEAAVPLRFTPIDADPRCDERAGLVRRTAQNVASVDAALGMSVPVGQGMKRLERIEIVTT